MSGIALKGPASDRDAAWALVGDTDAMNRIAGNGVVHDLRIESDGSGGSRVVGSLGGPLGSRMPFEEDDSAWVAGRYFRQGRRFESPVVRRSLYEAVLDEADGTTRPRLRLDLEPANALAIPAVALRLRQIAARWQAALDELPAPGQPDGRPGRDLPPLARTAWERWARGVPFEVAEATWRHLVSAPVLHLQKMRPWALADRWGLPRNEVLAGLLRGVDDGLVELVWSVRCDRCHGQVASARVLSDIADHAACPSCRLGFALDLGRNVEVVFTPHPGVVPRVEETFCTLFPAGAPDIHGAFILPPNGALAETLALPRGIWRIGSGGDRPDLLAHVDEGGGDTVEWSPDAHGDIRLAPGRQRLDARNPTTARHRLQVIRLTQEGEDRVPAAALTTLPEFRRRMAHQVLSPDTRVSTRRVGLLFTDLSGSTALYDALGDALAWAFVRDHFALLRAAVEAEGGHVVKTAGDAVMAAFDAGLPALRAAMRMQTDFEAWVILQDLPAPVRLKVGVHAGPALVVHSDAWGLDWFGQAVNIAARVQAKADAGELTWSDEVHDEPGVSDLLAKAATTAAPEWAALKGVASPMRLWRWRPPSAGSAGA